MKMKKVFISGTGLMTPQQGISNEELVKAFNEYVDRYNQIHQSEIRAGELARLEHSSEAFIKKASGITHRYVLNKSGILDASLMQPVLDERKDSEISYQAEMSLTAAHEALDRARVQPHTIDQVIVACSNFERPYPAIAIEIQQEIGAQGSAYDMNVACSSATFAIQNAVATLQAGLAKRILVVNPEICSGHLEFRDRDCHFIFGDAATAMVLESEDALDFDAHQNRSRIFEVLSTQLQTSFSNSIRNNSGFLDRTYDSASDQRSKLFRQEGRKVFKEVVPMVSQHIIQHLEKVGLQPEQLSRMWLHQANLNMNQLIAKKILGREATPEEAPIILDEYANTSSAGSIIAFHSHQDNLKKDEVGIISSFGAGYSVGSILVKRC